MEGVLLIDKPSGWTSFDVVNFIRKIIATDLGLKPKNIKVGHIGTLDPLATGLLVLLIGKNYTTKAVGLSKLDKMYEVEFKLGYKSPSMDSETKMEAISDKKPLEKEIRDIIKSFEGKISQLPPSYSALKVNGQRAYKLAREGKEVKLEPREVNIYMIEFVSYNYPLVNLIVHVSSGTYIRSLVDDIGQNLGTGAVMTNLNRTQIGKYQLSDSIEINDLNARKIELNLVKPVDL
jgi:tRNA pseudouridine55 synthase